MRKRWVWTGLRWSVVAAVVVLVSLDLFRRWERAEVQSLDLQPGWLLLAGVLYIAGWLPAAVWWRRVLQAMGQKPSLAAVLRAYYVGHLGKYIPGKAMVIVIRAWLMYRVRVPAPVAATSAVYETLSTMAVGALVSAAVLFTATSGLDAWTQRAALLLVFAGLPILPVVFNRMLGWLSVPLGQADPLAIRGITTSGLLLGMVSLAAGWVLAGLSLGATLHGIGAFEGESWFASLSGLPLWTASVSLAVVAGFLAIWFPAGVGVREGVLVAVLSPTVGSGSAVGAALVWRLISLVSEAVIGAFFYLLPETALGNPGPPIETKDDDRP